MKRKMERFANGEHKEQKAQSRSPRTSQGSSADTPEDAACSMSFAFCFAHAARASTSHGCTSGMGLHDGVAQAQDGVQFSSTALPCIRYVTYQSATDVAPKRQPRTWQAESVLDALAARRHPAPTHSVLGSNNLNSS